MDARPSVRQLRVRIYLYTLNLLPVACYLLLLVSPFRPDQTFERGSGRRGSRTYESRYARFVETCDVSREREREGFHLQKQISAARLGGFIGSGNRSARERARTKFVKGLSLRPSALAGAARTESFLKNETLTPGRRRNGVNASKEGSVKGGGERGGEGGKKVARKKGRKEKSRRAPVHV